MLFVILIGFFILDYGGSALLKKIFHIADEGDTRRWRWSKNKILFTICWFLLISVLVLKGFLYQLNAFIILYPLPNEIWQGVNQYRNHKENRVYILNMWHLLSLIILFVAVTIYPPVIK